MFKFTTRRVVLVSIVAALYVVLTVGIAPISYGVVQFRVSEGLKVLVLFDPFFAFAIGIGTIFANLASPFVGPWELIWMPITDIAGGLLAWALHHYVLRGRKPILPMTLYAITTGLAVGLMLEAFGLGGFWFLSATVALSEAIIIIGIMPVLLYVERMLEKQGLGLNRDII